jgi:hypothetical protein
VKIVFIAVILLASAGLAVGAWSVLEGEVRSGLLSVLMGGILLNGALRRWRSRKGGRD